MIQSMERQVQVVLRALTDVIAPALVGADKHVVEQLQLSVATLSFLAVRLPESTRFYRRELESYLDFGGEVVAVVGGAVPDKVKPLKAAIMTGQTLLLQPAADITDFERATRQCRDAIAAVVRSQGLGAARQKVEQVILAKSEAIIAQARVWCLPFGFELKAEDLPPPSW